MQFERSKACNYSAHVFLPRLFGVRVGKIENVCTYLDISEIATPVTVP